MGRRVADGGKSECRPITGRIGVEPPGEITPRESGLTSLGCLRTRTSEQLAWETEQMTAACCWCGLRRVTPVSSRPVSGDTKTGFSRTFDDAGPPPGTPVFFFQGILGRSRPEIGRLHRKCRRTQN